MGKKLKSVATDTTTQGIISGLFSVKGASSLKTFLVSTALAYFSYVFLYNIYQTLKILVPGQEGLLALASYLFPLLSSYVFFVVLHKRIEHTFPQKRVLSGLLGGLLFLNYLNMIGMGGEGSPALSIFFLFMTGLLPAIGLLVIFVACLRKDRAPEKDIAEISIIKGLILAALLLSINGCLGFQRRDEHIYISHQNLLSLAGHGSSKAQMRVAEAFATGIGTIKDNASAARWYEEARKSSGEGENADAAFYAGMAYDQIGLKDKARQAYKAAADEGNEWARQRLGLIPANPPQEWKSISIIACERKKPSFDREKCRHLAIAGNADAQYMYAEVLKKEHREQKLKSPSNIVFWYEQAALSGHTRARLRAAREFQRGEFHRLNIIKAAYWYAHASLQGYPMSFPRALTFNYFNKYGEK